VANTPQSKKRARQAETRRQRNTSQRSSMRTQLKKVLKAIVDGNKEIAMAAHRIATSIVDKLARKGLIHANKAARHKKRLNARIKKSS